MRSDKEIAAEALRRAAVNRKKKVSKKRLLYTISAAAASLAVIAGLSFFLPSVDGVSNVSPNAASATILSGSNIGGYVLIGVAGFVLGAAVTLFYIRTAKKD